MSFFGVPCAQDLRLIRGSPEKTKKGLHQKRCFALGITHSCPLASAVLPHCVECWAGPARPWCDFHLLLHSAILLFFLTFASSPSDFLQAVSSRICRASQRIHMKPRARRHQEGEFPPFGASLGFAEIKDHTSSA